MNILPDKKRSSERRLKKILGDSPKLKSMETKEWLRKKANYYKQSSPEFKDTKISKNYLMSNQEKNQNDIMEQIFTKFDTDGSGALDTGELVDLFKQNKINLDRNIVELMFSGEQFTLDKFKSMIDNDRDLSQFRAIVKSQKDKILLKDDLEKHTQVRLFDSFDDQN